MHTAVYEPIYRDGQTLEDPAFVPLVLPDNSRADWREVSIYAYMYRQGIHRQHRFTGLFSPKFRMKAKMTGETFLGFAAANASSDVIIANPFPQHPFTTFNGWTGGEVSHPGLVARTQAILDATRVPWDLSRQGYHHPSIACYCNFWVGTEEFWDDYVGGILLPIVQYIEQNPSEVAAQGILEPTRHTTKAAFLPFAVERLVTTKLSLSNYRVASMTMEPEAYCLTKFEIDLLRYTKPRVERAIAAGHFNQEVRDLLQFVNIIREQYFDTHFRHNIHPHLGEVALYPPDTLSQFDIRTLGR